MSGSPEEGGDTPGTDADPDPDGGKAPDAGSDATDAPDGTARGSEDASTEELRRRVEEEYDFEDFGPAQMDRMTVEEWEAAFDPETWITGTELLDRVEADLKARVVSRDVFARVERLADPERLVAYSDEGYAVVYADGSVEGRGTVLRDVKPSVALCSMDDYEVPPMPEGELLPDPVEVPEGSGEFGNLMLQVVAGAQVLAGLALLAAAALTELSVIAGVAGLAFLAIGLLLFFTVANARLSDRFRAEEYRNRLRAVGVGEGEKPDFLPPSARDETESELAGGEEPPEPDDADGPAA